MYCISKGRTCTYYIAEVKHVVARTKPPQLEVHRNLLLSDLKGSYKRRERASESKSKSKGEGGRGGGERVANLMSDFKMSTLAMLSSR